MVGFLTLSWDDITGSTIKLAYKLVESKFVPDVLVGILRGGWIIARLLGDFLGIDSVEVIGVKFYKGVGERYEKPVVVRPLISDVNGKKVLVVDDVADSGRTLQVAIELLQLYNPKEIRTSSLYVKSTSIIMPDFYVSKTDDWIVFPWEYAETLRSVMRSKGISLCRESLNLVADEIGLRGNEFINELINIILLTSKS